MRLVKSSFTTEAIYSRSIMGALERAGRVCYKSEEKIAIGTADALIAKLIKSGHHSVLEHEKITATAIMPRGISHELVRHRIASYSQESTRYCDYASGHIAYVIPLWYENIPTGYWEDMAELCEWAVANEVNFTDDEGLWLQGRIFNEVEYKGHRKNGRTAQEARGCLPIDLKTEVVFTFNLRQWRHFFCLRALGTTGKPHPQMQALATAMLEHFAKKLPIIFGDLAQKI